MVNYVSIISTQSYINLRYPSGLSDMDYLSVSKIELSTYVLLSIITITQ